MCKKIKKLKTSDPKEYWKLLNKGRDRKQPNCVILKLISSFRGPILTLSRRSVSKFSCCTRSSSGALFRFLKNLNKSPKGMFVN
jgi:hypothetical protein